MFKHNELLVNRFTKRVLGTFEMYHGRTGFVRDAQNQFVQYDNIDKIARRANKQDYWNFMHEQKESECDALPF